MIDLKSASRDDLIRLIVSQHETIMRQERVIAAQQERIATLEATVAQLTVSSSAPNATIASFGAESIRPSSARVQPVALISNETTPAPPLATWVTRDDSYAGEAMGPCRTRMLAAWG